MNKLIISFIVLFLSFLFYQCVMNANDSIPASDSKEYGDEIGYLPKYEYWYVGSKLDSLMILKDLVAIKPESEQIINSLEKNPIFKSRCLQLSSGVLTAKIDPLKTTLKDLVLIPGIEDICYVLEYNNVQYIPCNGIFVRCKEGVTIDEVIHEVGLDKNVQTINWHSQIRGVHLVTFSPSLSKTMSFSRQLYETGLCEWAEPNFTRLIGNIDVNRR